MSEKTVQERLDLLVKLEERVAWLEKARAEEIEAVIPPSIKNRIVAIKTSYADRIHVANTNVASTKATIKEGALEVGSTVKGKDYMAVWAKGKMTWDSKGLEGYAVAHPEVKAFRKQGKPYVSIKKRGK